MQISRIRSRNGIERGFPSSAVSNRLIARSGAWYLRKSSTSSSAVSTSLTGSEGDDGMGMIREEIYHREQVRAEAEGRSRPQEAGGETKMLLVFLPLAPASCSRFRTRSRNECRAEPVVGARCAW